MGTADAASGNLPRRPRAGLLVAGVAVLAGLVALASRAAPLWTPLRTGTANRPELFASVALVGGAGLVAAFALTLLAHRIRRGRPGVPLRETLRRAAPITSATLAVLILGTIARTELDPGVRAGTGAAGDRGAEWESGRPPAPALTDARQGLIVAGEDRRTEAADTVADSDAPLSDPWLLALLGAAAAAILGAALWWPRARPATAPGRPDSREESDPDAGAESLRRSVLGTIDAMLADPDPNTAIVGAYARLLEGLAACGMERRPHEAPLEHLRRALATLQVRPRPAHRLLELFQAARFSTHPLTPAHREQALEALRVAANDLTAGASAEARRRAAGARR